MDDDLSLDETEARVLGVLAEKSLTTPDQYPLTVNAATAGCNQKSNREPVMDLAESRVQHALETLMVRGYVGLVHASGGRTDRYRHNLEPHLGVDARQLALLTVMLLRGPQTTGELRTRTARMSEFDDAAAVEASLAPLIERQLVRRLPPAAGSRSARFAQLLSPDERADAAPSPRAEAQTAPSAAPNLASRVEALEGEVAALRAELARLREQLGD